MFPFLKNLESEARQGLVAESFRFRVRGVQFRITRHEAHAGTEAGNQVADILQEAKDQVCLDLGHEGWENVDTATFDFMLKVAAKLAQTVRRLESQISGQ